jgi:hypothetical protein
MLATRCPGGITRYRGTAVPQRAPAPALGCRAQLLRGEHATLDAYVIALAAPPQRRAHVVAGGPKARSGEGLAV